MSVFTNTHWYRYSDEENQRFFDEVGSLVKKFNDLFWVFKLHPDKKPDAYHFRFYNYNHCKVIYPREDEFDLDTQDILRVSDVVIMMLSTVALEAAILKKPVISINFTNEKGYKDFLEYRENIDHVLMDVLKDQERFIEQQRAFVEGYHPGKGNAVRYLKEMILSILQQGVLAKNYY